MFVLYSDIFLSLQILIAEEWHVSLIAKCACITEDILSHGFIIIVYC